MENLPTTDIDARAKEESLDTPLDMDQAGDKNSTSAQMNKERLGQDVTYIVLPDVADIPGQEHISTAGLPGEMADTTISSDDEEGIRDGKDLLEEKEEDDLQIVMGTEADVTSEDLALLGASDQDMDMGDAGLLLKEGLDDTDNDGYPLNEAAVGMDATGEDLDMDDQDANDPSQDAMGQDDEENSYYSLGNEDNDPIEERS
ncbi:MAG: hypothetical protein H7Y03_03270 [Chitinophagaceae bacterium]|nr:hypothetical protein [Chitinophagaceae bacterium]